MLGALAYLGLDVLVLWVAFLAVHAHPVPGFGVVVMAYIIGALGGSLPLPAGVGAVGGIAGALILYGVGHDPRSPPPCSTRRSGCWCHWSGVRSPTWSFAVTSSRSPWLRRAAPGRAFIAQVNGSVTDVCNGIPCTIDFNPSDGWTGQTPA